MTGANYMGGKRNAVKLRVRDRTGRAQKGFFGRQRLEILTKGLAGRFDENNAKNCVSAGRADISFAHAKHYNNAPPLEVQSVYIPSPTYLPPSTPRSLKRRKLTKIMNSCSSSSQKSEVLHALDTSQPMLLRGALDRILAMPDLACLQRGQPTTREAPRIQNQRARPVSDNSMHMETLVESTSDHCPPCSSDVMGQEKPSSSSFPSALIASPFYFLAHTPIELPNYRLSSSPFATNLDDFSSYEALASKGEFSESGYSDFVSGIQETSSIRRSCYSHSSKLDLRDCTKSDIGANTSARYSLLTWTTLEATHQRSSPSVQYQDKSLVSNESLQVKMNSLRTSSPQKLHEPDANLQLPQRSTIWDGESHFGNVFAQSDPWSAIGTILGLPSFNDHENEEPSASNLFTHNLEMETMDLNEDEFDDLMDDYSFDHNCSSLFDEIDLDTADFTCGTIYSSEKSLPIATSSDCAEYHEALEANGEFSSFSPFSQNLCHRSIHTPQENDGLLGVDDHYSEPFSLPAMDTKESVDITMETLRHENCMNNTDEKENVEFSPRPGSNLHSHFIAMATAEQNTDKIIDQPLSEQWQSGEKMEHVLDDVVPDDRSLIISMPKRDAHSLDDSLASPNDCGLFQGPCLFPDVSDDSENDE